MIYPSWAEFQEKTRHGNLIPVYQEILADRETPVSAFEKIDDSCAFLLESVEGGEKIARYSFLGSNPSLVLLSKNREIKIIQGTKEDKREGDPLTVLKSLFQSYRPVKVAGLPRFIGGAVGYLSYDMVRFWEKLPDKNPDEMEFPESLFLIADTILVFDHLKHKIQVVSNAYVEENPRAAYRQAQEKIEAIIEKLYKPKFFSNCSSAVSVKKKFSFNAISNFSRPQFEEAVAKAKEYIRAGEIIQVVLSQRFHYSRQTEPFDIYRALRIVNPSPYMYYLKYQGIHIIGSSPELLVRVEDGIAETRPIAGTRPRGSNEEEDEKLAQELMADPKECAEHIMLVDLGRNDLGRVCEYGSVKVTQLMTIERYSHVMHLVSHVQGKLQPGKDAFDTFRACFPAGTVAGAPKIRAMEIIEELEPTRRGPYAGAMGYFSFSGNLDTCITIRTLMVKDQDVYFQAGAGIVADSSPEREYDETINKARALQRAIEMAEKGLE